MQSDRVRMVLPCSGLLIRCLPRRARGGRRRVHAAKNLNAEKAQLQAVSIAPMVSARLVHELADLKRRQADEARAAERVDNATLP
jgi:hypothetical protein